MTYILDSDKAYGVRISIKSPKDESYIKFFEVIFHSNEQKIIKVLSELYFFTKNNKYYKYEFYVKAETIEDGFVKEKHYLWYRKTEEEFKNLFKIEGNNICFIDLD